MSRPEGTAGRGSAGGVQAPRPPGHPGAVPGQSSRPHGKVSSWVLAAVVIAAFATGGAALILRLWTLFWVCVGVFVLCIPVGMAIGIMDDTVVAGSTPGEHETAPSTLADERLAQAEERQALLARQAAEQAPGEPRSAGDGPAERG